MGGRMLVSTVEKTIGEVTSSQTDAEADLLQMMAIRELAFVAARKTLWIVLSLRVTGDRVAPDLNTLVVMSRKFDLVFIVPAHDNSLPALISFPIPSYVTAESRNTDTQRPAPTKDPPIVNGAFLGIRKRAVRGVDLHKLVRRPTVSRHVGMADPRQPPVSRFDLLARRADGDFENLVERRCRRQPLRDRPQSWGIREEAVVVAESGGEIREVRDGGESEGGEEERNGGAKKVGEEESIPFVNAIKDSCRVKLSLSWVRWGRFGSRKLSQTNTLSSWKFCRRML
ncbi:hypothetical protein HID58_032526 [Brassica napus]|uniref:Uncharacterized protein n=1 Tax=Brassica napus TaxID=3708 RepID=A0ABQ8BY64_BRANA|nr:hypothetical protein HID58_032526 [Brassica napus]